MECVGKRPPSLLHGRFLTSLFCRPLHIAALNGHPHVVKTLCEAGARLDARNFYMKTALHFAAIEGELESAKMLIGLCSPAEKEAEAPLREIEHPISGAGSEDVIIDVDEKGRFRVSNIWQIVNIK